jgi:hypothetical protein
MKRTLAVIGAALAVVAVQPVYILSNWFFVLPLSLRDHPWPFELFGVLVSVALLRRARSAFHEKEGRKVTAVATGFSVLATILFALYVNVGVRMLPPPPPALRPGAVAADFDLADETGRRVTLSSLRGRKTLLVFYRGFW